MTFSLRNGLIPAHRSHSRTQRIDQFTGFRRIIDHPLAQQNMQQHVMGHDLPRQKFQVYSPVHQHISHIVDFPPLHDHTKRTPLTKPVITSQTKSTIKASTQRTLTAR